MLFHTQIDQLCNQLNGDKPKTSLALLQGLLNALCSNGAWPILCTLQDRL